MPDEFPEKEFFAHCGDCSHEWLVAVIPMELGRFNEKLRAAVKGGCPKCDSRKVFIGKTEGTCER